MNAQEASGFVINYRNATLSGAFLDWNLETLLGVQKQLREAREILRPHTHYVEACDAALEKINNSIEAKRDAQKLDTRYEQDQKRQERSERRANWALGISIASFVLSSLFGLFGNSNSHNSERHLESLPSPMPSLSPTPVASGSP
jgi:hypothetical protein